MLPKRQSTVLGLATVSTLTCFASVMATASDTDCKQLEFTEDFSSGWQQRWKQLAGAEYEKSIVTLDGGGVALNLRAPATGNTQMVSKALFQSAHVEFTMQTNAHDRIMYNFVAWPAANEAGHGEMDLEILGGNSNLNNIMIPMYAPGVTTTTPILVNNPPSAWNTGSDEDGPTLDLGQAEALSTANWVTPATFTQTDQTEFTFDYSEDTIAWTANGKPYATYTKGTDDTAWPYGEPMMLSFALWTNAATDYDWMGGTYTYNEADPAALTITKVVFSGCVTNYEEATSGESSEESSSGSTGGGDSTETGGAQISESSPNTAGDAARTGANQTGGSANPSQNSGSANISGDVGASTHGDHNSGKKTSTVWVQPIPNTSSADDGEEETGTATIDPEDEGYSESLGGYSDLPTTSGGASTTGGADGDIDDSSAAAFKTTWRSMLLGLGATSLVGFTVGQGWSSISLSR